MQPSNVSWEKWVSGERFLGEVGLIDSFLGEVGLSKGSLGEVGLLLNKTSWDKCLTFGEVPLHVLLNSSNL